MQYLKYKHLFVPVIFLLFLIILTGCTQIEKKSIDLINQQSKLVTSPECESFCKLLENNKNQEFMKDITFLNEFKEKYDYYTKEKKLNESLCDCSYHFGGGMIGDVGYMEIRPIDQTFGNMPCEGDDCG